MDDDKKLINASDLIEWIMETDPDWCVQPIRSIVDHVEALPSAVPETPVIKLRADIDKDAFLEAWKAAQKDITFPPPENDGWIPVTERLPERDGEYLVTIPNFRGDYIVTIRGYSSNLYALDRYAFRKGESGWYVDDSEYGFIGVNDFQSPKTLAWMPLPEPYKED